MNKHSGSTIRFVPLTRQSLPSFQTPLVGRDQDISRCVTILKRQNIRLLTLTGPGGIGKTRLATAVAETLGQDFPQRTHFVSLVLIRRADQLPTYLLHEFNLPEDRGDTTDLLTTALRDSEMLLILDNFEHIIAAAPLVHTLLAACPGIKILATSRAALRISGEQIYPVPPLGVQVSGDGATREHLEGNPAVQLFVERALAAAPSLTFPAPHLETIKTICHRLDGLPLAIELAAAQSRILPPTTLLSRVEAGLALPIPGPRNAPDRQVTLHNTMSWSYTLLQPDEQRLLRLLGVFVGGFGLEAAEYISSAVNRQLPVDDIDGNSSPGSSSQRDPDTLSLLASLVENSMVQQIEWEGEARFTLLETVRQFALEKQTEHGEGTATRDAHAQWLLEFAKQHALAWLQPGGEKTLLRFEIEHANLLAALDHLDAQERHQDLLGMTTALGGFWYVMNHYREGSNWLERAISGGVGSPPELLARAKVALGLLLMFQREWVRADRYLTESLEAQQTLQDPLTVGIARLGQGGIANAAGNYRAAEDRLKDVITASEQIPDAAVAAVVKGKALTSLGLVAHATGDLSRAEERHREAMSTYKGQQYVLGMINALRDQADVARDQGNFTQALAHYQAALALLGAHGDLRVVVDALEGAAIIAAAWNQPHQAAKLLGAAEKVRATGPIRTLLTERDRALAAIQVSIPDFEIQRSWAIGKELRMREMISEIEAVSPVDASDTHAETPKINLTPREKEILTMLAAGHSDREISTRLFLSVRTVEAHVHRIRLKFEVSNRTAAVAAAIASGLIDVPPNEREID